MEIGLPEQRRVRAKFASFSPRSPTRVTQKLSAHGMIEPMGDAGAI